MIPRTISSIAHLSRVEDCHNVKETAKWTVSANTGQTPSPVLTRPESEFVPRSVLHHHNMKSQPFSVGMFLARSASDGAVPGLCLAPGAFTTAPVSALFQPLPSLFSLFASRALSTPYPVFMRVFAARAVNGNCCTGGDREPRRRKKTARRRRLSQGCRFTPGARAP